MTPEFCTVTVAEADVTPVAEAVITEEPGTWPATGTCEEVALAGMSTVAGTVAVALLLEVRFTVKPPAGAGPDRIKVKFCVDPLGNDTAGGVRPKDAETVAAQ